VGAQWVYNGCMRSGYTVGVQWMYSGCTMGVQCTVGEL
jgi:hypothetical protein